MPPPPLLLPRRQFLLALSATTVPLAIDPTSTAAQQVPALAGITAAAAPLPAVASFTLLADMVREVGGPRVAVRALVAPGADAHLFQPRPSDAEALRGAALLVRNGLGFEPWLDRFLRAAGYRGPVITATTGIEPRGMDSDHDQGHDHGGARRRTQHLAGARRVPDPHAWQDLRLGRRYVAAIAAGLAEADPAGAEIYRRNAAAYGARLAALDEWVRGQIATVPAERRKVITSHDAFGYFGDAYGVRFLSPQGVSTEAEPSAAQVAALIRQIRAEGITAVFVEAIGNPATLRRLAEEAGVRVRGRLYADALSRPDGPAPTYEAMFRHNVGLLVPAMRGDQGP